MLKFLMVCVSGAVLGLGAVYGVQNFGKAAQTAAPDPENSSQLVCQGVIHDRIDYTVTLSPDRDGFTAVEFRPRTSDRVLTAVLEPAGDNVWRGVSGSAVQAEVEVVRLAADAASDGNQIDVGYDGQWGRGACP